MYVEHEESGRIRDGKVMEERKKCDICNPKLYDAGSWKGEKKG